MHVGIVGDVAADREQLMEYLFHMETARKIRTLDRRCRLVFSTTSIDFAVDSYEADASRYLVKPCGYDKRKRALARCGANIQEQYLEILGRYGSLCLLGMETGVPLGGKFRVSVHNIPRSVAAGRSPGKFEAPAGKQPTGAAGISI